jgi:hypothetical protein
MSRKDYQEMAAIVASMPDKAPANYYVAIKTARMFKNDNSAFRPVQYFTACGFTVEQAGEMAAKL